MHTDNNESGKATSKPFQSAQWIWHPPAAVMDNFHLLARREFDLADVADASCRISCNSLCELWVNGRAVGRGPNPSFPGALFFDTHDLTQHLSAGRNVVAVRCYNFGPTMESLLGQNPGPGGLIVEITNNGHLVLVTDASWRVLQDPSRQQETEPISGHRGGFKEVCDGRLEVVGWVLPGFDDSDWLNAASLGGSDVAPFRLPIPAEIPPLRVREIAPVDAFFHTSGCSYGGAKYDVTRPDALLADDDRFTVIDPLREDFYPAVLLDFGRGVYGRFEIDFADGGGGGGVVEISYGESLNLTVIDRYILRPGPQRYSAFERRGGRYMLLTFRKHSGAVRIRRVVCHEQWFPVEPRGHFACSDALLNRIWSVGCDTSRANMQDHFEDAPWREQTLYTGDLVNSGVFSYYAWGDGALARKCLKQCARAQQEDGLIPLFGPAPQPARILPEYPALWVISLWNHHLHWGEVGLVNELWPTLQRCLMWYDRHSDDRGLFVRHEHEAWNVFIDNLSNIEAMTDLAAENILICHALRCAARLAESIGEKAEADRLRAWSERLAASIAEAYWSEERGCLVDSRPVDRGGVTQITNGLALLFDILPPAKRTSVLSVLEHREKAPPVRAGNMAYYLTEAFAHVARPIVAIQRIREYWGGMLDHGATQYWEVFDPESPEKSLPQRLWSLCHAFCAGPIYSLPARFGGIRALEPGFKRVLIAPRMADLDWVNARVATPRGDIAVTCLYAKGVGGAYTFQLALPSDVSAEVELEVPWRDRWSAMLGGKNLPIDRTGASAPAHTLAAVHPRLVGARVQSGCIRLEFKSSSTPVNLELKIEPTMGPYGQRIVVSEPAGNWDAAPKPLE